MKSGKIEVKSSLVSVQFEFSNRKANCNLEVLTVKVKKSDRRYIRRKSFRSFRP